MTGRQAHRIYEKDHALAIRDTHPYRKGYCLVLSKRHVPCQKGLASSIAKPAFRAGRSPRRSLRRRNPKRF
ncbi:MAG: HIT domain-containing protein [Syntrophales bacterium]|jgi:diadenosine tetraphosphate (Ap4A) HIT family hydrolase